MAPNRGSFTCPRCGSAFSEAQELKMHRPKCPSKPKAKPAAKPKAKAKAKESSRPKTKQLEQAGTSSNATRRPVFFERQAAAQCGMHALNNALQRAAFAPEDMRAGSAGRRRRCRWAHPGRRLVQRPGALHRALPGGPHLALGWLCAVSCRGPLCLGLRAELGQWALGRLPLWGGRQRLALWFAGARADPAEWGGFSGFSGKSSNLRSARQPARLCAAFHFEGQRQASTARTRKGACFRWSLGLDEIYRSRWGAGRDLGSNFGRSPTCKKQGKRKRLVFLFNLDTWASVVALPYLASLCLALPLPIYT